jgi:hypothetical protein
MSDSEKDKELSNKASDSPEAKEEFKLPAIETPRR